MSDRLLRLRTRAYLGLTGVFYLLVGLAYSTDSLRLATSFQPDIVWPCAFILAGILTLFGWVDDGFKAGRRSLYLASAVAAGFSSLFVTRVVDGELTYLLGAAVWAYIAASHFSVARLPDPFILALFKNEVRKLEYRLSKSGQND